MENGAVKLCADIADTLSVAIDHHDLLTCRKQSPRQSNTSKSSTDNNRLHKLAHSRNISALYQIYAIGWFSPRGSVQIGVDELANVGAAA